VLEGEALRLLLALAVSDDVAVWEGVCSSKRAAGGTRA
jgi:hypothetical protein